MLEAFRLQIPLAQAFNQFDASTLACHVADVSCRYTIDTSRQPTQIARADGKEQLEILAAVQREHKRVERAPPADARHIGVNGNARDFEASADAALFAQVREIG